TLHGQAVRDASPLTSTPLPLVIISHGYPGNRYLMSHLGENLASKGFIVASIDQAAVNADRYLLTFVNANHNAGAPIPAPAETYAYSEAQKSYPFTHYADAVWDSTRMNNILDHFVTAYFGLYLKNEQDKLAYFGPDWKGFKPRSAAGLVLEHLPRGK